MVCAYVRAYVGACVYVHVRDAHARVHACAHVRARAAVDGT